MHNQLTRLSRREIPPVNKVLAALGPTDLPRPIVIQLVRRELSKIRTKPTVPGFESIVNLVRRSVAHLCISRLQPVINGTGIVIHTNFGRAPLPRDAAARVGEIASGYSNLEYDLATGERGGRGIYIEKALALLCGGESATVVNNCAAALVLIVHHFAHAAGGRRMAGTKPKDSATRVPSGEIIVSRGEMVQIGGGFRVGEIIEATGAKLREVGATNKTVMDDYAQAIGVNTGMILKVHRSNFFMSGFVESPCSAEISALARKKRIPFVEDLGSGAIVATEELGIVDHEATPAEVLKSGVDLVCFSGDKLFGGPQAGIIAGRKRLITSLKREPLFRALRCDKLCIAALQTTVDLHLHRRFADIPTLAVLQISEDELRARAAAICARLQGLPLKIAIGRGRAKTGGGTLPKANLPSVTIGFIPRNSSLMDFAATLRESEQHVIGYIADGQFKLDLRTIFTQQDEAVVEAIRAACRR